MAELEQKPETFLQATFREDRPNAGSCNTFACNYMQTISPGQMPFLFVAASYCL